MASGRAATELQSDFGPTYGALLPISGRSALAHILGRIKDDARVLITADAGDLLVPHIVSTSHPKATVLTRSSREALESAVLGGLSALVDADGAGTSDVTIVFSDTLVSGELPPDSIGVFGREHAQQFTTLVRSSTGGLVYEPKGAPKVAQQVCVGVFHIADAALLARCLRAVDESGEQEPFYAALIAYHETRPLGLREVEEWRDLGHLRNYYEARLSGFQSRPFNSLAHVGHGAVRKTSNDRKKISREAEWYASLPSTLSTYAPRLLASDVEATPAWYEIEHVSLPTVAEQLVWGRLPEDFWRDFFDAVEQFLNALLTHADDCISKRVREAVKGDVYLDKTRERLASFLESDTGRSFREAVLLQGRSLAPLEVLLERALECCQDLGVLAPGVWAPVHGDLFPGNMFFDRRAGRLLCIDPRGSFGMPGIFGDPIYDLAKLSHSFSGYYDAIIAGLFQVTVAPGEFGVVMVLGHQQLLVEEQFAKRLPAWSARLGSSPEAVRLVEGLLFLGILPLHAEAPSRQIALVHRAVAALAAAGVRTSP